MQNIAQFKTCPNCQEQFLPASNRQILCGGCKEKEEPKRRRTRKRKELESFPEEFTTVYLRIARGELRAKREEIRVETETFRFAHKYYSLFLQFRDQLKLHSEEERRKGRRELADSLESDYKSLSAWELVPRTEENKAIPPTKEDWGKKGFLIFRRQHDGSEARRIRKTVWQQLELDPVELEEKEDSMESWLRGEE